MKRNIICQDPAPMPEPITILNVAIKIIKNLITNKNK